MALLAWALDGPLVAALAGAHHDEPAAERWLAARIAAGAGPHRSATPEGHDLLRRFIDYWAPLSTVEKQHAGVLATAATACVDFAAPVVAHALHFGCEPGARDTTLDLARLVSPADADGRILVFQPARDALDRLVAVALKALLFEAVLADPERERGDTAVPLVGYVADEFHRFVTADPVHGEQSYLDTCRAFGAFCLLATQSISSIEHALSVAGGSPATNEAAVSVLCNNTASKVVFRTTDAATAARMAELCPAYPGWADPLRVRPLSTLAPGECVAALADGRVLREQLRPIALETDAGARDAAAQRPARQPGRRRAHRPARDATVRTAARHRHLNERR